MEGKEIDVADGAGDRRTAEAHHLLMKPFGSRSLLVVPVLRDGEAVGAIWLEDAPPSAQARDFARAVANMVALRMAEAGRVRDESGPASGAAEPTPAEAPASREADLRMAPVTVSPPADVFGEATIMVLQLTDPVAMAMQPPGAQDLLCDELCRALQGIAADRGIPYLKIVGQQVIAAAGLSVGGAAAAPLMAEVALAARDRCALLFDEVEHGHDFRIGIDCGAAIGGSLGGEPRVFNLWGEAVRTAEAMASSALPGTIQATEAAYRRLRHKYLLRPRGRFYIPRLGEARTFVLAGRL
jgi:class 3 adenylate cyclase